ncbi:Anti-sigma-K factor rskA [Aquimixticola soesokkakensis]|uniref:Anti-sigma-K factor rskA n=1 Tax=Aquimixticola soesokkakensis TaxID=1519096 RepID=A0A1Y5TPM8_9RHOB|nr:anti-sigma factor [Aquimixticola soesokkakensis]SLN66770.1 Anti-sigma-K factor rskA [Aquimixticola soesokkakensis]
MTDQSERSLRERLDEVVLGLACEAEVAQIEALCARDPSIARQLERSRLRFLALDETADVEAVPAGLWARISSALDAVDDGASPRTDAQDSPADQSAQILPLRPKPSVRHWRLGALGGLAASLLLAIALGWSLLGTPQPTVVAVLLDSDGQPVALVEGAPDNTTLITMLEAARVPQDRVMQVWTKPDDLGVPVSLGLLAAARSRSLSVSGLPRPRADQLYEITFEPLGGSPTNLPTGPILAKGFAKAPIR